VIEIKNVEGITETATSPSTKGERGHYKDNINTLMNSQYDALLEEGISLEDYMSKCEEGYLRYAYEKFQSTYKVAQVLGQSQSSVMRRIKKYHISKSG